MVQATSSPTSWARQFSVFLLGGLLTALVDIAVTKLLLVLGVWYVTAVSAGFLCALCVNFFFHARITFAVHFSRIAALRYGLIVAVNYLLTLAIVVFVHDIGGGSAMLGKILSLPVVVLHGYLWSRLWIFKASANS